MTDDPNPFELDLDGFYERYLKTCAMSGVTRVSRERAERRTRICSAARDPPYGSKGSIVQTSYCLGLRSVIDIELQRAIRRIGERQSRRSRLSR